MTAAHRISWFVYTGERDETGRAARIPRTASMRGWWPGYDVVCTCGWETHTGGAVRSHIEDLIWAHKNGFDS